MLTAEKEKGPTAPGPFGLQPTIQTSYREDGTEVSTQIEDGKRPTTVKPGPPMEIDAGNRRNSRE